MGGTWRQRLNGRQRKAAGLIILAVFLVGFCGSRGGDSTERQPAGTVDHTDAGGLDATPTPWVEGSSLVTDLPEVEPSYYVEPTPEPTEPPAPVQAAATPVYRAPVYGAEQWRELVASIMPAETVDRWLRVIQCESGGNANAVGAQGELGLLQVHPRYHRDATTDPEGNVRAAYRISGGGYDFGPWSCKGW